MNDPRPFHVVDLFAGPGGLAEGFASLQVDGSRPFRIALSVEKDPVAHQTLRFRAFLRQFEGGYPDRYYEFLNDGIDEPDWATEFPAEWAAAEAEALELELGAEGASAVLEPLVDAVQAEAASRTVVIGGPPCQAYSIVGRARNKGKAGYKPATDERHFLYREYIAILERIRPAAFVMENVKGILSSTVDGKAIFTQVLADLQAIGGDTRAYELLAFVKAKNGSARLIATLEPRDFIICAEDFGIPQARHRVIIIGVRRDAVASAAVFDLPDTPSPEDLGATATVGATVRHVLAGLPELRSGLSKGDTLEGWVATVRGAIETVAAATVGGGDDVQAVRRAVLDLQDRFLRGSHPAPRTGETVGGLHVGCPPELAGWLLDPKLKKVTGHSSRGHMASDLARYLFVAAFAEVHGRSPVAKEFPAALAPAHKNWDTGAFADRFRAQHWDAPSRTITSHIAKDGHYFIHPDPAQCRALTVREAARLQTFPDNYRFLGNRTQQFIQVGNAVPPLLAKQIAHALHRLLSASGEKASATTPGSGEPSEPAIGTEIAQPADQQDNLEVPAPNEASGANLRHRALAERPRKRVLSRLKDPRGSHGRAIPRRARRR